MRPTRTTPRLWLALCLLALPFSLPAEEGDVRQQPGVERYPLQEGSDVVGQVQTVEASQDDTLIDIGRRYGIGYEQMRRANPGVSVWMPGKGTEVLVPTRFILPPGPREGVVVNVAEMRLYYYPPVQEGEVRQVETYPVSVGRMDWKTPLGETTIIAKAKDPAWYPPESIIKEHAEDGRSLPRVVPPGPDNPLGRYAMRLDIAGYLIHGTNRPDGVGMRVTHGCIRMLPEDIENLFSRLPVGTKVRLINSPLKVGWSSSGILHVQVYPALEEAEDTPTRRLDEVFETVSNSVEGHRYPVDFARLRGAVENASGMAEPLILVEQPFEIVERPRRVDPFYDRLELFETLYSQLEAQVSNDDA
ncbi:L,D-transpeptidase ErfK/SrfK [Modicisalibacter ilicicola DSM 19980]|uniref:L,D-transpeptidase ErfK/SrfK n=1 Tax=Modicisalibacter ilicicola DSM 19980 TaxID=1121942 RepID=A0A1M5BRY9_9GAMM|nr:L,D-transpeptidase family protein [Halomonas ilicicola]SHF45299.1 L,D-transpeptidase ErfK/SrfK [Halomonas ilicicola DSM 19980]